MPEPEWLKDVEPMVFEGRINVPYTWDVGETGSRFFVSLRDYKEILGTRCEKCNVVFVPPRNRCGKCFNPIEEWVKLGDEGEIVSFTVDRREGVERPMAAPAVYALIKLDGADTPLLHLIGGADPDSIRTGMRVKAVFAGERKGNMLDIIYFKPL